MRIYVIRHGETSWNVQRKLQGHKGADLDEKGVRLAEITAEALKDVPFAVCIYQPAAAGQAYGGNSFERKKTFPSLKIPESRKSALVSGRVCAARRDGWRCRKKNFRNFMILPLNSAAPPGGESIRDVCARTADFYQELIHNREYRDKTVLVSTHGCACRAFLNNVLRKQAGTSGMAACP